MELMHDGMEEQLNDMVEAEMDVNETVNMLEHESRKCSLRLAKRAHELGLDKIRDRRKTNVTQTN